MGHTHVTMLARSAMTASALPHTPWLLLHTPRTGGGAQRRGGACSGSSDGSHGSSCQHAPIRHSQLCVELEAGHMVYVHCTLLYFLAVCCDVRAQQALVGSAAAGGTGLGRTLTLWYFLCQYRATRACAAGWGLACRASRPGHGAACGQQPMCMWGLLPRGHRLRVESEWLWEHLWQCSSIACSHHPTGPAQAECAARRSTCKPR